MSALTSVSGQTTEPQTFPVFNPPFQHFTHFFTPATTTPAPHYFRLQIPSQHPSTVLIMSSSNSPVSSLPTELLGEIFMWSTTSQTRLQPHPHRALASKSIPTNATVIFDTTALSISLVSSTWRAIALCSADLWTTMKVHGPSLVALDLVKLYLSRAGTSALFALELTQTTDSRFYLDIGQIVQPPSRDSKEVELEVKYTDAIFDLWFAHAERWQSIFLDYQCSPPPLTLIHAPATRFPHLKDVALHYGTNQTSRNQFMFEKFWDTMHTLPTLRSTYWEYGHMLSTPFSQLAEFTLQACSLVELCDILKQCHQLEHLTIEMFAFDRQDNNLDRPRINSFLVPSLKVLHMRNHGDSSRAQALLRKITTPHLDELAIRYVPPSFLKDTLSNFLRRSGCSLRSLILGQRCADEQILRNLRLAEKDHLLDKLERLELVGYFPTSIFRLLNVRYRSTVPTSSQPLVCTSWNINPSMLRYSLHVPFPSLVALKVGWCSVPGDGVIGQMLLDRAKAGSRLWCLECEVRAYKYLLPEGMVFSRRKDEKLLRKVKEEFGSSKVNVIYRL
ncbi:hypothetical protein BDN72DRAFT_893581 [Pluteus cervinus]|uniref:Uncharacterized protein n=1 Tax=Pluteus cervinus TaxID=181527 RepID=A0ACD3B6Z7_9AGAR|nr:hypothetical protein BDN72DRAFT_893581 [Pluteus cervinus]